MARLKKNREANIIHFSFFDLLFGAFGAFVFLMIMQVLSTLNMVDKDIQKVVDEVVQEKTVLKSELDNYKDTDRKLATLQQQFNQSLEERGKLIEAQKQLTEKNDDLISKLNAVQNEMGDVKTIRTELERKENIRRELQARIEQSNMDKSNLDKKNKELETRMASMRNEIESLRQFKEKISQKGDLQKALEQENEDLKSKRARLAEDKVRLESELNSVREQLAALKKFKADFEKKGDVVQALEEENRKLEKSLDQTKQKLAALKTSSLKIKTTSLPTIITGEEIKIAMAIEGGSPPYTWKFDGRLPQGLSFNPIAGEISGIAKSDGNYNINFKVQDATGMIAESKKDIPLKIIEKYKEPEKKVSPMFVVMALISSLLLAYILWGKYKAAKMWKKIVEEARARGDSGVVIKI